MEVTKFCRRSISLPYSIIFCAKLDKLEFYD
jgi:hypothetical protein